MISFNLYHVEDNLLIENSIIKFWFNISSQGEEFLKFYVYDPFFDVEFIPGFHESSFSPGVNYWVMFEIDARANLEKPNSRFGFKLRVEDKAGNLIFDTLYLTNHIAKELRGGSGLPVAWIIGDSNVWASFGNDHHRYENIAEYFPVRCSYVSLSLNRFLSKKFEDSISALPLDEKDVLIFYLGEIDFRFSIHKARLKKNLSLEYLCNSLCSRYFEALSQIEKKFRKKILVLSPNPPIRENFLDPEFSPHLGTEEDRLLCFKIFDSFWKAQNKFQYLNWTKNYTDDSGFCRNELLETNNHHLKEHGYIKEELEKKLLLI